MNEPLKAAIAANRSRRKFSGGFDAPRAAASVSSQVETEAPSAEEIAGRIELVTPDEILVEAAKIDGLSETVLRGFARSMRLNIELRPVKVVSDDGKTTDGKRPFVVSKDGAGNETVVSLLDFFEATGETTVLDVLRAKPEPETEKPRGIRFPAQGGAARPVAPGDEMSRVLDAQHERRYGHNRITRPTQRDAILNRNKGAK